MSVDVILEYSPKLHLLADIIEKSPDDEYYYNSNSTVNDRGRVCLCTRTLLTISLMIYPRRKTSGSPFPLIRNPSRATKDLRV